MRIQSIDSFRVIAILAVISIHTQPFSDTHYFGENDKVLAALFYQGTRFAVPFFFIAAGYFFGKRLGNNKNQANFIVFSSILRVLEIWIFWNIFYIVTTSTKNDADHSGLISIILGRFNTFFSDSTWEHIIFEGARISLWFLISLALAYFIVGLFRGVKSNDKYLIVLSIILYGIGLLGGTYAHTNVGVNLGFNTRNGPFISTIFVASGYLIASHVQAKISDLKSACYILLAGIAMTFLEIGYLYFTNDKSAFNHEFFIGTYFVSLGIFLILVAKPQTVGWSWMPTLGRLTLGVYVSHSFFNWSLWSMRYYYDHAMWEIGYPVMVYFSSLLFVWLLSRIKLMRRYII